MTTTAPRSVYARAADYDLDEGGWAAKCVHGKIGLSPTRDGARSLAKHPETFCTLCAEAMTDTTEPTDNTTDTDDDSLAVLDTEPSEDGTRDGEVITDDEPASTDVIGTFATLDRSTVHDAVALEDHHMTTRCGQTLPKGDPATHMDGRYCVYCLAGLTAPPERPVRLRRTRRAAEPVDMTEHYAELTEDLQVAADMLRVALEEKAWPGDAVKAHEILEPLNKIVKHSLPRRRIGKITGARSGLVSQSRTRRPSREMTRLREFAEAGDKRAQEMVAHIDAYTPGEDCSYCLSHYGVTTRHAYATAFASIGRELRAMEHRAQVSA